jgi:hypothetical protein
MPYDEVADAIICVIDGLMTSVAVDLTGYSLDRNSRILCHGAGQLLATELPSA